MRPIAARKHKKNGRFFQELETAQGVGGAQIFTDVNSLNIRNNMSIGRLLFLRRPISKDKFLHHQLVSFCGRTRHYKDQLMNSTLSSTLTLALQVLGSFASTPLTPSLSSNAVCCKLLSFLSLCTSMVMTNKTITEDAKTAWETPP